MKCDHLSLALQFGAFTFHSKPRVTQDCSTDVNYSVKALKLWCTKKGDRRPCSSWPLRSDCCHLSLCVDCTA